MTSRLSADPGPSRPPLETPERIEAALDQVLSLIATAERLSRAKQIVNLSKLDLRVSEICTAIAAQPPKSTPRFAARLSALVAGLDTLEVVTREAYQSLADARGESGPETSPAAQVSDTTRASAAYSRALAVTPNPGPEPSETGERRRVERRMVERRRHSDRRAAERRDRRDTDHTPPGSSPGPGPET